MCGDTLALEGVRVRVRVRVRARARARVSVRASCAETRSRWKA